MNCKTSLHIAFAAALLLAIGTGCASIVRELPEPNPVPDINVPLKVDTESTATADESSAPSPQPAAAADESSAPSPEPVAATDESSAPSPEPVAATDESSTPLPEPVAATDESSALSPKPAVTTVKPALKRGPQSGNVGFLSKTPVAQPPSAKPDGSLTRLDEMKKQGTMSEEAYGQIKRQILENPE